MNRLRLYCLAAAAWLAAGPASAQTIAITGGTVYPVSGPKIDAGTVLIRDGRIAAVGTNVAVPSGAVRIDATGKVVTPGFFHPATDMGLTQLESGGDDETQEGQKQGDINAAFNVAEGINPDALTIAPARIEGITTVLSAPSGGLVAGQAVVIDLAGDGLDAMLVKSPAAMVLDLSQGSKSAGGGSRAGALERLRQLFADARDYAERRADFRKNQMQPLSAPAADLEALRPVLNRELPVYVTANRRGDIQNALRLAREFNLRMVLVGAVDGWQVARDIAAAGVPVIIAPLTDIPSFDGFGARLDNAALLRAAGVTVLLGQQDVYDRNLRYGAGNAVANGMTWDDALRAVTLGPAEALGLGDRYGSLESGKVANVVVWSGDPFDFSSAAEHVIIRGREVPLVSRQTELFERYKTLPPSYQGAGDGQ